MPGAAGSRAGSPASRSSFIHPLIHSFTRSFIRSLTLRSLMAQTGYSVCPLCQALCWVGGAVTKGTPHTRTGRHHHSPGKQEATTSASRGLKIPLQHLRRPLSAPSSSQRAPRSVPRGPEKASCSWCRSHGPHPGSPGSAIWDEMTDVQLRGVVTVLVGRCRPCPRLSCVVGPWCTRGPARSRDLSEGVSVPGVGERLRRL